MDLFLVERCAEHRENTRVQHSTMAKDRGNAHHTWDNSSTEADWIRELLGLVRRQTALPIVFTLRSRGIVWAWGYCMARTKEIQVAVCKICRITRNVSICFPFSFLRSGWFI